MDWKATKDGLAKQIDVLVAGEKPILMWRIAVSNTSENSVYLDSINMLQSGARGSLSSVGDDQQSFTNNASVNKGGLRFNPNKAALAFFSNGWQSWNYAGTVSAGEWIPRTKLGPFVLPMRENALGPRSRRKGHCVSDMFAVLGDRASKLGLVLGFISQREAFGSVEGWLHKPFPTLRLCAQLDGVQLDPDETFQSDWAYLQFIDLKEKEPLADYLEFAARANGARVKGESRSGWCSWYYAFEDLSQAFLLQNLEWIRNTPNLPLDVFQVDDGYQKQVGDWFDLKETFPDGLQGISKHIRETGLKPGIWLAPFITKRKSQTGKAKKHWILRNKWGLPVNAGFLWDSFPYVLDVTHPEVLEHIQKLLERMTQVMRYEYLKLDFLYAGALPGRRFNPKLTRAQSLYQALHMIRHTVGDDVELLGCGIPLGSGIGIFDHMRIGPDVAPKWNPSYRGIKKILEHDMGLPACRNAILTTINRLPMHKRWWTNDPDCLLLRTKESNLSEAEVQTLASVIAMSGGAMMLSDHLPELGKERIGWLYKLLPPLPQAARAVDWFDTSYPSKLIMDLENPFDSWHLICLINWADSEQDLSLDLADFGLRTGDPYHLVDFWNQKYHRMQGSSFLFAQVPAHGVRMLSVRRASSLPMWLGDSLNISQGLLIKGWEVQSDQLHCLLKADVITKGMAWIELPGVAREIVLENQKVEFDNIERNVVQLGLSMHGTAQLKATWI
jgi:alpha-galactosidase